VLYAWLRPLSGHVFGCAFNYWSATKPNHQTAKASPNDVGLPIQVQRPKVRASCRVLLECFHLTLLVMLLPILFPIILPDALKLFLAMHLMLVLEILVDLRQKLVLKV